MEFQTYIITLLIIYLIYFIFVIARKKAVLKFKDSMYVRYLVNVYKINVEQMNSYFLANMVAIVNSFILATALFIVSQFNGLLKMIVGFFSVMILLFGMYHILGMILKKKGDKNV
jgi:hypothetical protein